MRIAWIALIALAGCGPPAPETAPPGAPRREPNLAPEYLRPAPVESGAAFATRAYLSESQNGRSAYPAPAQALALRLKAPLAWGLAPRAVLTASGRVLIEGSARWTLLDANGRLIRSSAPGASRPVLDPAAKAFYFLTDRFGPIEAASLDNGARLWDFQPDLPDGAARVDLRLRGRTLVAISERPGAASPVEVFEIGPNPAISDGILTSARKAAALGYPGPLLVAASGSRLALALKGRLVVTDWQLRLRDEFERPLEPAALSLDEGGRVYVLSGAARARQLAAYSPRGEQTFRADLGHDFSRTPVPPLVSFDHRVFALLGDRVAALSANGEKLWIQQLPGLAGGIVTADDQLLLTAGAQVLALDGKGSKRVLATLDEPFVTAPVLTENGEVLAATARYFVTFGPKTR